MPGVKSRDRSRNANETKAQQPQFEIVHGLFPLETTRELLKNVNDSTLLRDSLQTCFEQKHLWIAKPQQPFVHFDDRNSSSLKIDNSEIATDRVTFANSEDDSETYKLIPLTDLWDAGLLDYFMEVIYWALHCWYLEDEGSPFTEDALNPPTDWETVRLNSVCVAMTTFYLMLQHMQLWQNANPSIAKAAFSKGPDSLNGTSGLVMSVRFLKAMLQTNCPFNQPEDSTSNPLEKGGGGGVDQFQVTYSGLLTILTNKSAVKLVGFCTTHFLHIYRLMEQLFGPISGYTQDMIDYHYDLKMETLPQNFGSTKSKWPPPLSEAIPLSLAHNHADLFDDRVKQWFIRIPIKDEVEEEEPAEEEKLELEVVEASPEPMESPKDPLEKYLLLVDTMTSDDLKAIAQLSKDDAGEAVEELIKEIEKMNQEPLEDVRDELKTYQLRLASRLIEAAQQRLKKMRKL